MPISFLPEHAILFWYLLGINLFTLIIYAADKISARAGAWRVRERTLLILALLGGSAGALLAMHVFRHKTKKPWFGLCFAAILLAQIAVALYLYQFGPVPEPAPAY